MSVPLPPDPDRPWIARSPWSRPLAVAASATADLARWIAAGYPHETCGLLVGREGARATEVVRADRAKNLNAERARDRFDLDPADFLAIETAAERDGLEVVGVWHSHPDCAPRPSITDHQRAFDGYSYLIARVGPRGVEETRSWRRADDSFHEQPIEELDR